MPLLILIALIAFIIVNIGSILAFMADFLLLCVVVPIQVMQYLWKESIVPYWWAWVLIVAFFAWVVIPPKERDKKEKVKC